METMRAPAQAVPPKITAPPSLGIFAAIVLGAAALGAMAVVFFFDPAKNNFYPVCLFHKLTGLNCPGCGATRALFALLHGHFLRALHDNALFVVSLAALAVWSAPFVWRKWRNQPASLDFPPKLLLTFLAVAIGFAVLRNLPAFAFLSP
jgi:Protein of unknown function (DUF2752)